MKIAYLFLNGELRGDKKFYLNFINEHNAIGYFPAYEIMIDELRDYRFYADDMIHPSEMAINYIWERFSESYIDLNCFQDMNLIESIQKGIQHRIFNTETEQCKHFQEKLQQKITQIIKKYPFITF